MDLMGILLHVGSGQDWKGDKSKDHYRLPVLQEVCLFDFGWENGSGFSLEKENRRFVSSEDRFDLFLFYYAGVVRGASTFKFLSLRFRFHSLGLVQYGSMVTGWGRNGVDGLEIDVILVRMVKWWREC